MESLAPHDIVVMLTGFAVMLGLARAAGELFNRLGQPAIVGEILAGILLGPTVLGTFAPGLFGWLFPGIGPVAVAYDANRQDPGGDLYRVLFEDGLPVAVLEKDEVRMLRSGDSER